MRVLLLLSLLALCHGAPRDVCSDTNCARPSCSCFSTAIPGGLDVKDVPQMVMLTYDDAISQLLYDDYYSKNMFNRQNPNGCNISATFFTTHEYNDYHMTYQMYRQGHEIALHSIT
ncbi:hypothetical protein J437_LFUL008643 [Ladona fulva]|uniref:Uncharacterized protein n=1 Tax=Ladona fulva TaxID=123851 RepID=A0A8K0K565_LADFU|nr:hypothetical protein J437_LFUL008643 [Ladona fulva]